MGYKNRTEERGLSGKSAKSTINFHTLSTSLHNILYNGTDKRSLALTLDETFFNTHFAQHTVLYNIVR
jgi:hypothetical protein